MEAAIQKIKELVGKISEKLAVLNTKIANLVAKVPGFLKAVADKLLSLMSSVCSAVKKIVDWVLEKLAYAGGPEVLSDLSDTWLNRVGAPVSDSARTVSAGELSSDDIWAGLGADQYREKLPEQNTLMNQVESVYATNVSSALSTASTGIVVFWVAVGAALVPVLALVIAGILAACTVIGAGPGAVAILTGCATALAALGVGLTALFVKMDSAKKNLQTALADGANTWTSFALDY